MYRKRYAARERWYLSPPVIRGSLRVLIGPHPQQFVSEVSPSREILWAPSNLRTQQAQVAFSLPFAINDLLYRSEVNDVNVNAVQRSIVLSHPRRQVFVNRADILEIVRTS
jgi:hypothetical protein